MHAVHGIFVSCDSSSMESGLAPGSGLHLLRKHGATLLFQNDE